MDILHYQIFIFKKPCAALGFKRSFLRFKAYISAVNQSFKNKRLKQQTCSRVHSFDLAAMQHQKQQPQQPQQRQQQQQPQNQVTLIN